MSYTVVWKPRAEQDLARLWLEAADRRPVNDAARDIDRLLRVSPLEQGESRAGSFRVFFREPLVIFYNVNEADRLVTVIRVMSVS